MAAENIAQLMLGSQDRFPLRERMKANMLVLSRRVGEAILIGPDIEVVVVATNGEQVRIGITAPSEIMILRRELVNYDRQALTDPEAVSKLLAAKKETKSSPPNP